ncbi:hypothetical protein [Zooshikella ganghwensis]|uniref:hypothetical protein n=1 Tax=Zooshikella ganghwensis TaxID=202772 RepID=UPI0004087A05|nr:hypothetical protein [Zooshikella ganghwensis]
MNRLVKFTVVTVTVLSFILGGWFYLQVSAEKRLMAQLEKLQLLDDFKYDHVFYNPLTQTMTLFSPIISFEVKGKPLTIRVDSVSTTLATIQEPEDWYEGTLVIEGYNVDLINHLNLLFPTDHPARDTITTLIAIGYQHHPASLAVDWEYTPELDSVDIHSQLKIDSVGLLVSDITLDRLRLARKELQQIGISILSGNSKLSYDLSNQQLGSLRVQQLDLQFEDSGLLSRIKEWHKLTLPLSPDTEPTSLINQVQNNYWLQDLQNQGLSKAVAQEWIDAFSNFVETTGILKIKTQIERPVSLRTLSKQHSWQNITTMLNLSIES